MTVPWEKGTRKTGKMNYEVMHSNLLAVDDVLTKYEIQHVLIFGGLLGLIRGGELIEYDDDVEFACFPPGHRKMKPVIEELTAKGFYIPDKNECPLGDHFLIRDMEKIELWWFQKIDDEYIYDNTVRYPKKFFDTTEEIEYLGRKWKVPSNPKEFLTVTYGADWVTPNPRGRYILGKNK